MTDYSKDVTPLLREEVHDYDTRNLNETGINDGRMRLPTRYDIAKFYKRNVRNRGKHRAGEYGQWLKKDEEDLLDFSDDFDWQITYAFPDRFRNSNVNGANYGGSNVTLRRLYLILCEHFNDHQYFIDQYFDEVYPFTIKPEVDKRLDVIKADLIDVANYELAGGVSQKKIRDYEKFAREWEDYESPEIADMIKEDIISCVTSGQLPCQFASMPSESTQIKRLKAGLSPLPIFSATEQLIRSIQLFVKIRGNKKWQTQSGTLV